LALSAYALLDVENDLSLTPCASAIKHFVEQRDGMLLRARFARALMRAIKRYLRAIAAALRNCCNPPTGCVYA